MYGDLGVGRKRHKLSKDARSGKYFVRFQVRGARKYFPLSKNRKAAEAELTKLERKIDAGEISFKKEPCPEEQEAGPAAVEVMPEPNPEMRLKELILIHLDWVKENRAENTYELRKHYVLKFLEFVGDRAVSSIDRLTLEKFYTWARQNHGRSPNGGNIFLRNVKTMFFWADDLGICPCPVRKFPHMPEILPLTKRFTDEELSRLLQRVGQECPDFHDIIVFGLLTGLRPQELRQLTREHYVQDGAGDCYIVIERHKTSRSARKPVKRSVPLAPGAVAIINRQIARHPQSNHIFFNNEGNIYTASAFRQRLLRWCKRVGTPLRPPYALRHTFGTMEAEANINQTVLGQIMGHSQLRTTARYISHNAEHHRKAVGAIEGRVIDLGRYGQLGSQDI